MRIAIFLLIWMIIEWYGYVLISNLFKKTSIRLAYIISNILLVGYFVYFFLTFDRSGGQTQYSMLVISVLLMVYVPKIITAILLILQDIYRCIVALIQYFNKRTFQMPKRKITFSRIGIAIGFIPFLALLYGVVEGKYDYTIHQQDIYFDRLPKEFDGFRIVQISDIHCGSLDDVEKVTKGIELINQQDADLIIFTGDLVNNLASETQPWKDIFSKIKMPKYGKLAVLGNHDYGEYVKFPTERDKQKNFEEIKKAYTDIGFDLLLNENRAIIKNNDTLFVVGVENWGKNFKQVGDLNKASQNLKQKDFKIVLTHDPSHWDAEVRPHPLHFDLTLSGHTHGMQMGIEIPNILHWSPAAFVYKQWGGLYRELEKYIYVNRGFGFHAYAGRIGIWPEITVLQLKKSDK